MAAFHRSPRREATSPKCCATIAAIKWPRRRSRRRDRRGHSTALLPRSTAEDLMASASWILDVLLLGVMSAGAVAYDADPSDAEERAVEATIAQLHSGSKHERRSAVERLANTRSKRATEGLIAALDDLSVSEPAVAALAQRAQLRSLSRRAIEGLIHALDN